MRFALPKNRTAPLIIFTIFGILLSFSLALFHMNRVAQYGYASQCEECEKASDNATALIRQKLENATQSLKAYADYFAKAENMDKLPKSDLLSLFNHQESYVDLSIVDQNGTGYNCAGEIQDNSKEEFFVTANQGDTFISKELLYTPEGIPYILQAIPIDADEKRKGVLAAKLSSNIDDISLLEEDINEGAAIYIINENNKLIAFINGSDITDFNYDRLITKGSINSDGRIVQQDQAKELSFFNINEVMKKQILEDTYVWTRKDLGLNHWSVLYGKMYTMNPTMRELLKLTNVMWVVTIIATLFLFLLMIFTQEKSNKKLVKMMYLDPVTGGDNWYRFRMTAKRIVNSKQFIKKNFALVNFDINRFKIINDAYGYHKGDEILKDIFNVIKKWIEPGETFARYAADQFYILMSYQEQEELLGRLKVLNDQIHELQYTKTARIFYGVYHITDRTDSIDRMGEFAGIAKNNIKGSAEHMISFFDDVARGRLIEEEEIEKSMNEALKNNEFMVYLQPKYTAKEETISGAEALVRWSSKNGEMVSPGYFIPVFEKNGFITELDFYMLKKICAILKGWLEKGFTPLPISVNLSRLNFVNHHLAEVICQIVDSYQVPHPLIELELTESAFLQNKEILIETVIRLREYGFLVSMDDFGAGYSSLNSLKDIPLDVVKLDGELFRMTDAVERGLTVIRNTITMAKDLQMKVVAECIETKEQVEFLSRVGCDIIQGYYFAKPMPVDQFEERYFSLKEEV